MEEGGGVAIWLPKFKLLFPMIDQELLQSVSRVSNQTGAKGGEFVQKFKSKGAGLGRFLAGQIGAWLREKPATVLLVRLQCFVMVLNSHIN